MVQYTFAESSPGPLPPIPTQFHDLGRTYFSPQPDRKGVYQVVPGGPNTGYVYLTGIPATVHMTRSINTVALSAGSTFWSWQPDRRRTGSDGTLYCSRDEVLPLIPPLRRHEGTSPNDPDSSHVRTYMDYFAAAARPRFEALVRDTSSERMQLRAATQALHDAALAHSIAVTDKGPLNPLQLDCTFNFDPNRTYLP